MLKTQFTLRPYQNTLITDLAYAVKAHRRVIACAATGAGKSKTFLKIAANALLKGYTVLVITESRKIYDQLIAEAHATEIKAGSKLKYILPGGAYLAMAQTLRTRDGLIAQFAALGDRLLIINDECHINEATNLLLQLPAALLIGFSASPIGKHLVKLYNHLVVGPQPHELVLNGFLSPYKHFERTPADISQLERDSIGEFTEESQERVFGTQQVYDGLLEDLRITQYRKSIIYTSSIRHCEEVAAMLNEHGYRCVSVHSRLGKELEKANLQAFTHGLIQICVSVGILTKGFDYPPIDLIVLLRATTSLALFLQMIGRASRVLKCDEDLPVAERKKKYFTVLDYGKNCTRHFPWDWERDWQALWRGKPKKAGVSPIKVCPQCTYVNTAAAKQCVNCGYVFQVLNIDEPPADVNTILVEVTAKYNKLVGRKISDLTPEELSTYAKSKGKKTLAIRVAKWHARHSGDEWLKEFAKNMGYKPYWVHITLEAMRAVLRNNPDEEFKFSDVTLQ